MMISQRMDEPIVVYWYTGILLCHEKEGSMDTTINNMDKSPKQNAKSNKVDKKEKKRPY